MAGSKRKSKALQPTPRPSRKAKTTRQQINLRNNAAPPFNLLYNQNHDHEALLCLDLGTSKVEVAYTIAPVANPNPLSVTVNKLPLKRGFASMPSLVGVMPDRLDESHAKFVFGYDAQTLLDNKTKQGRVWSNLKQNSHFMDPNNLLFAEKRVHLQTTQSNHEDVLAYARKFQKIELRFPRGHIDWYYPNTPENSTLKRLDSVQDVVVIFFTWMYDLIKFQFANTSGILANAVDTLFSSRQVRIGVAVPDVLPASNVTRYYDLLLRSGFSPRVQMLSEARCAAVKVCQDLLKREGHGMSSLGQYEHTDITVCDIGHGTTDISTIRTVQHGANFQFKFAHDPSGNSSGAKVVEDNFLDILRGRFENDLWDVRPREGDEVTEMSAILEGFRRGIAEAKCDFSRHDSGERVVVTYRGPGEFCTTGRIGEFDFDEKALHVPSDMIRTSYNSFLDPITRVSKSKSGKKGLLQKHFLNVQLNSSALDTESCLFLVSGAATPEYVQFRIKQALEQIGATSRPSIAVFGDQGEAYVASGGVLMLSDKELCKRRFHNESLGCIIKSKEEADDIEKVDWIFVIGQRIDIDSEFSNDTFTYDIELDDQTVEYPIKFEWSFARTNDEEIGKREYPNANSAAIRRDQGIQYDMSRELCEFIGWKLEHGVLLLRFDFRLHVILDGQVVHCKVIIPEGGELIEGKNVPTREFEALMTADLSHLVQEDLFEDVK